jgi:hypothetical protein
VFEAAGLKRWFGAVVILKQMKEVRKLGQKADFEARKRPLESVVEGRDVVIFVV